MATKIWPRITIVTPSFNQGEFLGETIESIVSQNYPNLEYYIVDGGSSDQSLDVIKQYSDRIDWWVSERDRGQSDAINRGFRKATGELIGWVNSDDVLLPSCLSSIAETYRSANRPDVVHANSIYIDQGSRIVRFVRTGRQTHFWITKGVWYASAPAIFFKRSSVAAIGYLDSDLHMSMDVEIWLKLVLSSASVAHVPEYLGGFRWHQCSKTVAAMAQRKQKRSENPETERLFDTYLAHSCQRRRWAWRKLWKLEQLVSLRYVSAFVDTLRYKGMPLTALRGQGSALSSFNDTN